MGWVRRSGGNFFSRWLGQAWHNIKDALAMPSERSQRRLKGVQQLEDRCLLSVSPVGPEFRVNTYTQGAQQTFPQTPRSVAMNPANGNFVAVWSSQGQNGGGA